MHNTITIYSTYAGSKGEFSFFAMHRWQRASIDGAPVTNVALIYTAE